jgi:hypothetical protein
MPTVGEADGRAPPVERRTALTTALAAIARFTDLKRPRSRVLHRRRAPFKACSRATPGKETP